MVDAALQLRADKHRDPAAIERVTARVSEGHSSVMQFRLPADAMQAKFSLEFAVAAPLIFGRLSIAEMRDDCVRRDDVQALMRKVRREEGPDDDPIYPVGARCDTVSVVLADGTELESEPVYRYRGHGQNPLSPDELRAKFMDCATSGAKASSPPKGGTPSVPGRVLSEGGTPSVPGRVLSEGGTPSVQGRVLSQDGTPPLPRGLAADLFDRLSRLEELSGVEELPELPSGLFVSR